MRQLLLSRADQRVYGSILVGVLIFVGIFAFTHTTLAADVVDLAKPFVWAFGILVQRLVGILGTFLINLFFVLIAVAGYNQFLGSSAVTAGWVVVRDIVNMFFVLVLLAIAIGTILQQQQYHYSQTLPKFLAAAILVNFSKTICGIFIDFSQVVMMTFVGAISGAIGGNLAALLGIPLLLKQVDVFSATEVPYEEGMAFGGFFLALAFVCVALIVVGIMVVMLVIRIVALWFLIILSPTVFFFMALPNDRGYGSKWWDQFINYLLVGPVMMFFLWLSLTVVASQSSTTPNDATQIKIATELGIDFSGVSGITGKGAAAIGTALGGAGISTIGGIAGYILGICMLMGSLMAAQQLSSVGGSFAGAGAGYVKDWFAGKRGMFNPMKYVRDRTGAVRQRLEERQKAKVQRDMIAVGKGISVVAKGAGKIGQYAARRVMERPEAMAIRRVATDVSSGIDNALAGVSGGWLGFGRNYTTRMSDRREQEQRDAEADKEQAGQVHRTVRQLQDGSFGETELNARTATLRTRIADRQNRGLNTTDDEDELRFMEDARNRILTGQPPDAQGIHFLQARTDNLLRESQGHDIRASLAKGGMYAHSWAGRGARFVGKALLDPLTFGGSWAIKSLNDLREFGEDEGRHSENAELAAIEAEMKELPDDFKKLQQVRLDAKPGSVRQRAAAMKIAEKHSDKLRDGELEAVRRDVQYEGVGSATREAFEGKVMAGARALEARGLDADRITDLVSRGVIKGENLDESMFINLDQPGREGLRENVRNLVRSISRLPGKKAASIIKEMGPRAREMFTNEVDTMLQQVDDDGGARDAGTGEFTNNYRELLRTFLQGGGNLRDKVGMDIDGNIASSTRAVGGAAMLPQQNEAALAALYQTDDFRGLVPMALGEQIYRQGNFGNRGLQVLAAGASLRHLTDMDSARDYATGGYKVSADAATQFFATHNDQLPSTGVLATTLAQRTTERDAADQRQREAERIRNEVQATLGGVITAARAAVLANPNDLAAQQALAQATTQENEAIRTFQQAEAAYNAAEAARVAAEAVHRTAAGLPAAQQVAEVDARVVRKAQNLTRGGSVTI